MKFQLMLANVMNRFMGGSILGDDEIWAEDVPGFVKNILDPIFGVLGWLLPVIMILLGLAGTVYAIVLGVNYAKAESADQKDAAKKRLINTVIGIVIIILALLLVFIFIKNVFKIFDWVSTSAVPGE